MIGQLIEKMKIPGFVRPFRHYDSETGMVVEIKTSPRYTTLIVGGKEFFFIRETGKYDGFGAMASDICEEGFDD